QVGDGRLAGTGETGEPDHGWFLVLLAGAGLGIDVDVLVMNVLGTTQRKVQHAGTNGVVGETVDEQEAAELAVVGVGLKGHRAIEADVADTNLVHGQLVSGQVLHGVDVDAVLQVGHGGV